VATLIFGAFSSGTVAGVRGGGVILTRERESYGGGVWRLPKADLIAGIRVMLEKRERELGLSSRGCGAGKGAGRDGNALRVAAGELRAWRAGEHDDLVIAMGGLAGFGGPGVRGCDGTPRLD
jgi:hypothetical protein